MFSIAARLGLILAIGTFGLAAQAAPQGTFGFADNLSTKPATLQTALKWECMTDEGYGRKLPCSMSYKAANPNWRGTEACHIKDSKGKITSCSDTTKTKLTK